VKEGTAVTNPLQDDWRTEDFERLCAAILTLGSTDDVAGFLRDLCTHNELDELSGRWSIVLKLAEGLPYREIARQTGTSTATVTRVNQWLQHGTGGYRQALDRLAAGRADG
jgi:TrpR-related protein YerC/YecD